MPRRRAFLLLFVLVTTTAVALVVIRLPGEEAPAAQDPAPGPALALASGFPQPPVDACGSCHFSWERPFDVNATRVVEGGNATYRLALAPVSGYDLVLVAAAPEAPGSRPATSDALETQVTLLPPGTPVSVAYTPPWPASVVLAEAVGGESYRRVGFQAALAGASHDAVPAAGAPSNQRALLTSEGEGITGQLQLVLTAQEPRDAGAPVVVRFRAFPLGYRVAESDEARNPAVLEWRLPSPGVPGAPEGFRVTVVPFNAHPTENLVVTVNADAALYEGTVSAREPEAATARAWTPEALEAPWKNGAVLLHEEAFDGLMAYSRAERGEWERVHVDRTDGSPDAVASEVPPPVAPLPPLPPGSTHVRLTLAWETRTPLSPEPSWGVAYTLPPKPDFRYPEPSTLRPGERVDFIAVNETAWGREWFQAFPFLRLDQETRATFDGAYTFRVEALRESPG